MPVPTSEPRAGSHGSRRTASSRQADDARWVSQPEPGLRVSDSERADVADRLSKHYGDGRLDQAEFNARLDHAMNAKTHGDLHGLFDDLPGEEPGSTAGQPGDKAWGRAWGTWDQPGDGAARQPAAVPPAAPRKRRGAARLGFLILVGIATVFVVEALAHSFIPWLVISLVVAFLWLRDRR